MATATLCTAPVELSTYSYDTARYSSVDCTSARLASTSFALHLAAASFPRVSLAPASKRRRVGPPSSFRLFEQLPVEIVERVVAYLELEDLARLRTANRAFHSLLQNPRHYADISIAHLPLVHPSLLAFLPSVLSGTRHLSLRSFPSSTLAALLPACSDRLTTLDLSFSGVCDADLLALASVDPDGGGAASPGGPHCSASQNLRTLRLKGCRRISTFLTALCASRPSSSLPALSTLDLSWSSLSALPLPLSAHLPALTDLALATTPYLPFAHLAHALRDLPPQLRRLDLSHLGLGARELRELGVVAVAAGEGEGAPAPPAPLRLVLAGNDALTLRALDALQRHWASPASRWAGRAPIEVEHSPVLLESDDEDDVRRFVHMVAGVVMRGGGAAESGRNGT
ncbi:hypothetical protein JCM10450v2_005838 [Rhodotorula kratochvilovae]